MAAGQAASALQVELTASRSRVAELEAQVAARPAGASPAAAAVVATASRLQEVTAVATVGGAGPHQPGGGRCTVTQYGTAAAPNPAAAPAVTAGSAEWLGANPAIAVATAAPVPMDDDVDAVRESAAIGISVEEYEARVAAGQDMEAFASLPRPGSTPYGA